MCISLGWLSVACVILLCGFSLRSKPQSKTTQATATSLFPLCTTKKYTKEKQDFKNDILLLSEITIN